MDHDVIKAIEDGMEGIKSGLDERVNRKLDEFAREFDLAGDGKFAGDGRGNRNKGNPFAKLADDAGLMAVRTGNAKSAIVKMDAAIGTFCKASTVVGDTAGTSEEGYNVQPMRDPRLANDARRALTLLDFLPSMRVSSNSFEFNALTGYTNAAGYQASEGDLKPNGSLPTDLKTANIATIAHVLAASEQVLADVPALQQQISSLMRYGVMKKLETELISGLGGAGKIAGLTHSGNFTAYTGAESGDALADAVAKGVATLDAAGWNAGVVIVNPNDWRDARRERADAGAGVYVAGSWRDPAPPSIWGVPVITNPAVTAGNFVIMDPSQVVVLDRMAASVEMGRIDDDFGRNVVRIRAELRAGLAVFAPGAVLYGDWEA